MVHDMIDRESIVPLGVGAVLALLVNALLLGGLGRLGDGAGTPPVVRLADVDDREKAELHIGRDRSPTRTSVAWIPYDDVRELLARPVDTEQPAVQKDVDPTPNAPLLVDATEAAAQARQALQQTAEAVSQMLDESLALLPPISPPQLPDLPKDDAGEMATTPPVLTEPIEPVEVDNVEPPPVPSPAPPVPMPAPEAAPSESQQPAESDTAQPRDGADDARPTASARTQSEAPPTAIEQRLDGSRTGGVLVIDGLEVRPVAPRIRVVTYLTSAPRQAIVDMTFNREGRVVRVDFVQSSRYIDIDAAIESACYRWRAEGEKLRNAPHTIRVTFK